MWSNNKPNIKLILICKQNSSKLLILKNNPKLHITDISQIDLDSSGQFNVINNYLKQNITKFLKKNSLKNIETLVILDDQEIEENLSLVEFDYETQHYFTNLQPVTINNTQVYYQCKIFYPNLLQKIIACSTIQINLKLITTCTIAQITAYQYNNKNYNFILPEISLECLKDYLINNVKAVDNLIGTELLCSGLNSNPHNIDDMLTAIGAYYLEIDE